MDSVKAKLDVKIAVSKKINFLLKSWTCSTFVQLFPIVFLNLPSNPLSLMTFTVLQGLHSTSQDIFLITLLSKILINGCKESKNKKTRRVYKCVERGKRSL